MNKKILLAIALLPLCFLGCKPTPSPAATVHAFYSQYLGGHGASGLPDSATLDRYDTLLSQELIALLRKDLKIQAQAIDNYPDEKPPWAEGDLFSSLFEGPTSFQVSTTVPLGESAQVMVEFEYRDSPTGERIHWKDVAIVKRQNGGWRIDDIEYRGGWDFGGRGRLKESLR